MLQDQGLVTWLYNHSIGCPSLHVTAACSSSFTPCCSRFQLRCHLGERQFRGSAEVVSIACTCAMEEQDIICNRIYMFEHKLGSIRQSRLYRINLRVGFCFHLDLAESRRQLADHDISNDPPTSKRILACKT
jgi:hypothetical protein